MKIGLILTAYDCERHIRDCLKPWLNLRNTIDLIISANSGMFKPYKEFGFKEVNDTTRQILNDSNLDFLITTGGDYLLDENSSRNMCLDYLKRQNVDLIWAVDGDEIYTEEQILNIIDFIKSTPENYSYFVNFKNYTFKYPYFTKGFHRETIYKTNVCDGISHFHFDCDVTYNNGKKCVELNKGIHIPKNLAFVDHYSWLSNDYRNHRKVIYQEDRFEGPSNKSCAFRVDGDKLFFNKDFWHYRNLQIPNLNIEYHPYTHDFELTFDNNKKYLFIDWISRDMNIIVKLFSLNNLTLNENFTLNCTKGIKYFISPSSNFFEKDFKGFGIEVWENNFLIHREDIYVNHLTV